MTTNRDDVMTTLDNLIETCRDGENGFVCFDPLPSLPIVHSVFKFSPTRDVIGGLAGLGIGDLLQAFPGPLVRAAIDDGRLG